MELLYFENGGGGQNEEILGLGFQKLNDFVYLSPNVFSNFTHI